MLKKITVKNKIINHLMVHGKKTTSEKILNKSVKELQKTTLKQTKELIKLSLLQTTPMFKLQAITKKKKNNHVKEIPIFLKTNYLRTSLAIKFIINTIKKKNTYTYKNLTNEFLLSSKNLGDSIKTKQNLQESVLKKKHLFKYYQL